MLVLRRRSILVMTVPFQCIVVVGLNMHDQRIQTEGPVLFLPDADDSPGYINPPWFPNITSTKLAKNQ